MYKPMSWMPTDPNFIGIHWSVKNIFELKNAKRVIVEGNIMENHWKDSQKGPSVLFTILILLII